MAAPMATHRSGSTSPRAGLPKTSNSRVWITGVRVAPPTRRISSICDDVRAAEFERGVDCAEGLLDERSDQLFVVRARQLEGKMNRPTVALGEVFLVDPHERVIRESLFRALGGALDARHGLRGSCNVHPLLRLEMLDNPLDDLAIEVVAAEMVVAVARDHLDDAFLDPNDRHVECSAAEIVDQQTFALLLRGLIDQRRRRRLIDDAHHFQPGDLAGGARRLPLRVGEKGRHGDHRLADRPPKPLFGGFLEALQNDR